MKFAGNVILIALFSYLATTYMPWWMIAVVSFVIGFVIQLSSGRAFLSGFAGVALCFLILILLADSANEHILSTRMAKLFGLPNYSLFIAVNVFLGGLVGGLAAWSGAALRAGFIKTESSKNKML
jgi:hypothetical protein